MAKTRNFCIISKKLNCTKLRVSYNGSTAVFQTVGRGSIPRTRSSIIKNPLLWGFLIIAGYSEPTAWLTWGIENRSDISFSRMKSRGVGCELSRVTDEAQTCSRFPVPAQISVFTTALELWYFYFTSKVVKSGN